MKLEGSRERRGAAGGGGERWKRKDFNAAVSRSSWECKPRVLFQTQSRLWGARAESGVQASSGGALGTRTSDVDVRHAECKCAHAVACLRLGCRSERQRKQSAPHCFFERLCSGSVVASGSENRADLEEDVCFIVGEQDVHSTSFYRDVALGEEASARQDWIRDVCCTASKLFHASGLPRSGVGRTQVLPVCVVRLEDHHANACAPVCSARRASRMCNKPFPMAGAAAAARQRSAARLLRLELLQGLPSGPSGVRAHRTT
eukprot:2569607-Rhodomonas_salina.2